MTWNPPSPDSGGGPLTAYQVQLGVFGSLSSGWSNCTAFVSNHSCLFTDLRSKTSYEIRVRAFNKKGPGQWAYNIETTDLIGKYCNFIQYCYVVLHIVSLWHLIIRFFYSSLHDLSLRLLIHKVTPSSFVPLS